MNTDWGWGIFSDQSSDNSKEEAVEFGIATKEEAEAVLELKYSGEYGWYVEKVKP